MAKVTLAKHMRERRVRPREDDRRCGPFLTVSRQYGCWGFSLGLLMRDILNEEAPAGAAWRIYSKEILERLATETNLASEILERQRRCKPRLIVDFLRGISGQMVPSGHEIRNKITTIIRGLAIDGLAIIVGQGGAGATADLPNGLCVRLEAPEDWRIRQIAFREGVSEAQAKSRMLAKEQEREYLRRIYDSRFPRKPGFNLVYDCSAFTLAQIAQHVMYAMRLKGCL